MAPRHEVVEEEEPAPAAVAVEEIDTAPATRGGEGGDGVQQWRRRR